MSNVGLLMRRRSWHAEMMYPIGCTPLPNSAAWYAIHASCTQCTGLRTLEAQSLLSQLATCPNIYLVASFDDVNTPVLWDE